MEKYTIYIAGPLFSEAEQAQRIKEEKLLREFKSDLHIFNAITKPFNHDDTGNPVSIFKSDYEAMQSSNVLFFDICHEDSGTILELGFTLARYMENKQDMKIYVINSHLFMVNEKNKRFTGYEAEAGINWLQEQFLLMV